MFHRFFKKFDSRKIKWISSKTGDQKVLASLDKKMEYYYSTADGRNVYQHMVDSENDKQESTDNIGIDLIEYIGAKYTSPLKIIEIGCGRGNIYKRLRSKVPECDYYGVEVAPYIVEMNKLDFPEASWSVGTAYKIPYEDNEFHICFAHFVLEHLIYIEDALLEMLRVLKPKGELILIFPDFVELKALPSQFLGLSPLTTARQKLKQGRILDATISLFDSRIRIPARLKQIKEYGTFPINTNPVCLIHPESARPDVDAVYIASKEEIASWALSNHHKVRFPKGKEGKYRTQAFMVIEKGSD